MHRRTIPVASVQTPAHDRASFDAAWPQIVAEVEAAGARGARLIVLPEGTVPGYVLGNVPVDPRLLDRATADLAACARATGAIIVYGSAKIDGGITYNAAVVIGPDGRELGYAAKQFLWHFDRLWFAPGRTLEPIDTPLGKLGVMVCADGRIPSIAATLVERGAEILVMPTAWVTSGRDPGALENIQADLMVNVRARENGVPFVAANKCGIELESVAYCGKSIIVDAAGRARARASERVAETIVADVEIGPSIAPHASVTSPIESPPMWSEGSPDQRPQRSRIAFTSVSGGDAFERLAALARTADADGILAAHDVAVTEHVRVVDCAGQVIAAVSPEVLRSPRGLVAARLAGIDIFACRIDADPANLSLARTRAAELRAYVIVFESDRRAFVVDPDGVVLAGTFDDYRIAAFVADRARTSATQVAPNTDVLRGLRIAEELRAAARASAARS